MLDTVKLRSPAIGEELAALVEASLVLRTAVDLASGERLYEIFAGELAGSFDHRASVRVQRERFVSEKLPKRKNRAGRWVSPVVTSKVPCAPYIELEGSVHKALLGHNVYGGPVRILPACRWFVADVGERLGVRLPAADSWELRRLDWAEAFGLDQFTACQEYVFGLNNAAFPRRRVRRYGSESLFAPGTSSAVKLYHKGPEFTVHDARRLGPVLGAAVVADLQLRANGILRGEVQFKARKLDEVLGVPPKVGELTETWVQSEYEREMRKLLREGSSAMETIRTARDVEARLIELYGERQGASLFTTWVRFSTVGEDVTRRAMKRATFYLHRKLLVDAGAAWHGTDVQLVERPSLIPAGFAPVLSDPRRLVGEDARVVELLAPYHAMAAD